jgi:hypothetical protein
VAETDVTAVTVVPRGMPSPVTYCPTEIVPVTFLTVTVLVPGIKLSPEAFAVKNSSDVFVSLEVVAELTTTYWLKIKFSGPLAVAMLLSVIALLLTLAIVVPAGTPIPVTNCPTAKTKGELVLDRLTVVVPLSVLSVPDSVPPA